MHLEKERAAEKSAARGKGAGDNEDVFEKIGRDYAENAQAEQEIEDKRWEGFGDFFAKEGGTAGQNANQRNDTFMTAYKNGEEWLMNGDDDSLAKGFINRLRSSFGEGTEDLAYLIYDYAPWYEPAKKVIDKNIAGNIAATADRQFEKAKEKTGKVGDRLIDFADSSAEALGYSMFGPKAFYALGTSDGLEEYRIQRENGIEQELASRRALARAGISIIEEKADDLIGKYIAIDDVLYGKHWEKEAKPKLLQNANGDYIIEVKKSELSNDPNSITQVVNSKGGCDRNYYGNDGKQVKQISNNGHGHPIEEAMGKHGEHAHDYYLNEEGKPKRQPARELTYLERKENEDFL